MCVWGGESGEGGWGGWGGGGGCVCFFFNDTATTEIYTLSLHDALPIWYAAAILLPAIGVIFVSLMKNVLM